MASQIQIQEALARERGERRRLARRKSYDTARQRTQTAEQLLAETKLQCVEALAWSQNEAADILAEAHREAAAMLERSELESAQWKARREEVRSGIARLEARLQSLTRQADSQSAIEHAVEPEEVVAAAEAAAADFRMRDAARKRDSYRRKRQSIARSSSQGSQQRSTTPATNEGGSGDEQTGTCNRAPRSVHRSVSLTVSQVLRRVNGYNADARNAFFRKFWLHPSLKEYQPSLFGNPRRDLSVAAAVSDLKRTLQAVKTAKRKDHLSTKQVLTTALTGEMVVSSRYQTTLARALGIQRQNLHRASKRRKLIDRDISIKYPMGERKVRSDKISDEVRKIVEKFWESNTRVSPCKKDKARLRLCRKVYEEHRIQWLEETEVEFFLKFRDFCLKEENGVQIGLRSFQYLKPYYIRTMKDRNVCCCKQHVEMDLFKEALNKYMRHEHRMDCNCDCETCRPPADVPERRCVAYKNLIGSVSSWIEEALCPKALTQQWHRKRCIMGRCKKCSVKNLKWCPEELGPSNQQFIDWDTYEYVELDEKAQKKRERKKGNTESATKKATRLRMVHKRSTMLDFKEIVEDKMKHFIVHSFRAKWQAEQFRLCLKTFPRGTIVSSIDFSENYSFKSQNEIQSLHWDNKQITLLIHVVYRHREDSGEDLETAVGRRVRMSIVDDSCTRDIIADYNFYVSDDNLHDTLMVQHCMDAHHGWMKGQGIQFDQHWVWSDGAASQFKSCRPFYYIAKYYKRFGVRMKWFFHASGHGKGVADGLGGHIKQGLEKEQLKGIHGHRLENARDAVEFLKERFAMGQEKEYGDVQLVRRMFWEIPVGAVNRRKKWDCDTIDGSRSLHTFDGFSPRLSTLLQVRELSCFCHHCVDDEPMLCQNRLWVGKFKLKNVRGVLPADVIPDVEEMGNGKGLSVWKDGTLADLIQVGDYFAMKAESGNDWGVGFYILQCEEPVHIVNKAFTDEYGEVFAAGDRALKALWYQPVKNQDFKYVLNDSVSKSYVHAETVVHIRFGMIPCEPGKGAARRYSLQPDAWGAIADALSV